MPCLYIPDHGVCCIAALTIEADHGGNKFL